MLSLVNLIMLALLIFGALALSSSGSAVSHSTEREEFKNPKRTPDKT